MVTYRESSIDFRNVTFFPDILTVCIVRLHVTEYTRIPATEYIDAFSVVVLLSASSKQSQADMD